MRTPAFLLSTCILVCASGCSFIDDFGSFTVTTADAGTSDLGSDAGTPQDLGDRDAGSPDAGPIGSVVDIGAGSGYTCALFSSGRLRCWGSNFAGVLGNGEVPDPGDPGTDWAMPQDVIGLPGPVQQFAAGRNHVCAIVDDEGTPVLFCWGSGYDGQFGDGTSEAFVSTPKRLETGWEPRVVAAGGKFTCVIQEDDEVFCAGDNLEGQLGNPNASISSSDTFVVTAMTLQPREPTGIVAGWINACVITAGTEACWGAGDATQLGRPSTDDSPDAVDIGPAARIAIGNSHMCALASDGAIQCWGYGRWGQLGSGSMLDASPPVGVTRPIASGLPRAARAIAAARDHTCAIFEDTTGGGDDVYCWGLNDEWQIGIAPVTPATDYLTVPTKVEGIDAAVKLTTGDDHVCALTVAGDVFCWGSNWYLELGPGFGGDNSATPIRITGLD